MMILAFIRTTGGFPEKFEATGCRNFPRQASKNPRADVTAGKTEDSRQDQHQPAGIRRKFIDPLEQLPQHSVEMFANPTKPMMAAAALKRVAWHFILARRDFRTS
jgi:hypothetical protein